MTLRATSFLIPPGRIFRGEWEGETIEVAHSTEWPGDPEVIRCDRGMADDRTDAVAWFYELIFENAAVIEAVPRTDYAGELLNLIRHEERQAPGQVTLF